MTFWQYVIIIFVGNIIIQIGMIWRRKIIEKNKLKRIDKLSNLDCSIIKAIGRYEKRSSFFNLFKQRKET